MAKRAVKSSTSGIKSTPKEDEGHDYSGLLAGVAASFESVCTAYGSGPLFVTDTTHLPELYLRSLPSARKHHTCSACRNFLLRFGGLVTVADDGNTVPVMWQYSGFVPDFYSPVFSAMRAHISQFPIGSPFLTKETVWGTPITGNWSHMAVNPPADRVYQGRVLTPGQAMAAAKENFRLVNDALAEYSLPLLDKALRLLETESLPRSEKFVGPVQWLRSLKDRPVGRLRDNLIWRAVATAPEGYCHIKSSVVHTLLDDIECGLDFKAIARKFGAKVDSIQYQRPQAPPKAGNIKAAEEIVDKLGVRKSLERRFARLHDLQTIWRPRRFEPVSVAPTTGVFSHVKPRAPTTTWVPSPPRILPSQKMTWVKFASTVLPGAELIEMHVPTHGNFIAMTTALHVDAPPIFKWDYEDARNPVAWYVYHGGSDASKWGLRRAWTKVTAVAPLPPMWGSRPRPDLGEGVILVLDGARDTRTIGNSIFPECLIDELHGARATIEVYSRTAVLVGKVEASACGYDIRKGGESCDVDVRVLASDTWLAYHIDRWD